MRKLDDTNLEVLGERLPVAFYGLVSTSLLFLAFGSVGGAFFLLVLGAIVHVARVGVEEA